MPTVSPFFSTKVPHRTRTLHPAVDRIRYATTRLRFFFNHAGVVLRFLLYPMRQVLLSKAPILRIVHWPVSKLRRKLPIQKELHFSALSLVCVSTDRHRPLDWVCGDTDQGEGHGWKWKTRKFSINRWLWVLLPVLLTYRAAAQQIQLDLAYHKHQKVTLLAANGVRKDTLQQIVLDAQGKGSFNLRDIKTRAGLVGFVIKADSPPDVMFEWLYSPTENPTIVSTGEYVHRQNTQILNSPENQTFDRWATNTYLFKQKQGRVQDLLRFYLPTEGMSGTLQHEQKSIEKQLVLLSDSISRSPLFAAACMQFRLDIEQKLARASVSDSSRTIGRDYFRSLDFEKLYASGVWFDVIKGSSELYDKSSPFHRRFGTDMVHNLSRIHALPVYTALADAAISICEARSWEADQGAIIDFLLADNRLQNPTGKLRKLAEMQRLQVGKFAPDLYITKRTNEQQAIAAILPADQLNSQNNTLLIFHESGCGHCEQVLNEVKQHYETLRQKGWRIISMAADHDAGVFQQTAASLPWPDSYCDLKGFTGINFKNYAIIGTPTLFVIAPSGKIKARTALMTEVLELANEKKTEDHTHKFNK